MRFFIICLFSLIIMLLCQSCSRNFKAQLFSSQVAELSEENPVLSEQALQISDVDVFLTAATTAEIAFNLDRNGRAQILYGTDERSLLDEGPFEDSLKFSVHKQKLSGLMPETKYYFKVVSDLGDSETQVESEVFSFQTEPFENSNLSPPVGYSNLVWSGTPSSSDKNFESFLSRVGLRQRFGDHNPKPDYKLSFVGGKSAMTIVAKQGSTGASGGFIIDELDKGGVKGGPQKAFVRVKVYWHEGYDYNPRLQDSDGQWTVREGAGGCKFAGPWGGSIPATANNFDSPGWALSVWTGASFNYTGLGLDVNSPRNSTGYAKMERFSDSTDELFRIDANQGRWVQLEWELEIESKAGDFGKVRHIIDGVEGIDKNIRFMPPGSWDEEVGVKGLYLRNFYGGKGRAHKEIPVSYTDLEIWAP